MGDTCERCDCETDYIMQGPRLSGYTYVCETCYSALEEEAESEYEED